MRFWRYPSYPKTGRHFRIGDKTHRVDHLGRGEWAPGKTECGGGTAGRHSECLIEDGGGFPLCRECVQAAFGDDAPDYIEQQTKETT